MKNLVLFGYDGVLVDNLVRDQKKIRSAYRQFAKRDIAPFQDTLTGLKALNRAGMTLGIVTTQCEAMVNAFCQQFSLRVLIPNTHMRTDVLDKQCAIRSILAPSRFDAYHTFYVGRQADDIGAANEANVWSVVLQRDKRFRYLRKKQIPDYDISGMEVLVRLLVAHK